MINFLYDLTATQPTPDSKFHGGGTYAEIVFFQLLKQSNVNNIKIHAVYDSSRYINKKILEEAAHYNIEVFDLQKKNPESIFDKVKINRFYSALLDESIPWPVGKCEVITTVHGLRSLEMPLDKIAFKYETNLKEKIKTFIKLYILSEKYFLKVKKGYSRFFSGKMKIVTVSQHSKASILSFFPVMKNTDIKVFSSPTFEQLDNFKPECADFNIISQSFGIQRKKYFLITSSARWIKNAMRAVQAFDSLFKDGFASDFQVVMTGVNKKAIFEKVIHNKNKFIMLDYVERDALESLHKNSYAFIYPSLNEGFGYPPIEAMKYKIPVAASGTSSIPEVCGDAVLYFDPYSINEIKNRIIQLLSKENYEKYSGKAFSQYESVSKKQKKDLHDFIEYLIQ